MSSPAIRADQLSKSYRLGSPRAYRTLRETVSGVFRRRPASPRADDLLWALRDVSFEVARGEVAGVIGRNGAGKSTLLKILSRITAPTAGRAVLRGRVGSLLEVGTGFHHELTGRENLYLSGAILGMRRREIARKFDEIVGFAGVERFIDTPVKHYSSGMYVRLAFVVAAHLETELLLVDEVLAVGDAAFQLKCLNKMAEISGGGKTILFVSHNLEAVTKLCRQGVLLEAGRVARLGTAQECVDQYLASVTPRAASATTPLADHPGRTKPLEGPVRLTSLTLLDEAGEPAQSIPCGGAMTVALGYELRIGASPQDVSFSVTVSNLYNHRIACCRSHDTLEAPIRVDGTGEITCRIPRLPLVPGLYKLTVACATDAGWSDGVYDAATFEVVDL